MSDSRLARARTAGRHAGFKLAGAIRAVPPTPWIDSLPRLRFYVVLQGSAARRRRWPAVFQSWASTREAVMEAWEAEPATEAVFHAFASWSEVEEYCRGASVAVPPLAAAGRA